MPCICGIITYECSKNETLDEKLHCRVNKIVAYRDFDQL